MAQEDLIIMTRFAHFKRLAIAAIVALTPLLTRGAANDIRVSQKNATDSAWVDRIFAPASGGAFTNASGFLGAIGAPSSTAVNGYFADPTTNASFALNPWTNALQNVRRVDSIAALRLISVTGLNNGAQVSVSGYYAANDGGGGTYVWNSTSTTADNGGTVIQPSGITTGRWLLQASGAVSICSFGAISGDIVDCTTAIQKAVSSSSAVFVPSGTYKITAPIVLNSDGFKIIGQPGAIWKGYGPIDVVQIGDGFAGTGGLHYRGVYNGVISDLEILAADSSATRGIYGRGAREMTFINVKITGASYPPSGFNVAGVEMRESWVQRWIAGRVEYCTGSGFYLNAVDNPSNDINFQGFWASHNSGVGFVDGGGYGRNYSVYAEDNGAGGISLSGVSGFHIAGTYFESNVGFDVKVSGSTSGKVVGCFFTSGIENNHKQVWLTNSSIAVEVGGNSHYFGGGFTGGVGVFADSGLDKIALGQSGLVNLGGGTTCSIQGGSGFSSSDDGVVFGRAGASQPIITILQEGTDGTAAAAGLQFATKQANAGARNWAIMQDTAGYGDLTFNQSDAQGGNPFTSGTQRLRFKGDGSGIQIGTVTANDNRTLQVNGTASVSSYMTVGGTLSALGGPQNITGSRGGNSALASLLNALAAVGLITDSTTP